MSTAENDQALLRLTTIVINTTHPERLAPFWQQVLGVEVARRVGDFFIWLTPQPGTGVAMALQKVADPTPHPNRLHVDSVVADRAQARRQIEQWGGSHVADHEVAGFTWSVMADPEGNEFCIAQAPTS